MITGAFLSSRGAVHSALVWSGFEADEIRRSWRALRWGQWSIDELLERFRQQVMQTGQWQSREHGGYHPVAVDTTAYWRPRLRGWPGKLYCQLAGKAVTGIGFGLIVDVGKWANSACP